MSTIYYGGPILTMEGEHQDTHHRPEAILVRKGMILKTGTLDEMIQAGGRRARRVDLKGRCLMPAFIDTHSHIPLNGQMAMFADLSGCSCFDDVIRVMKDYIAENKISPKHVAMGFGYDHNFLAEQAHPGKAVLDQVSRDIPILIMHVSAHLACVNSAMLALAGYTADTPDPKGGHLGRVPGSTEPDGYLEEAALMAAQDTMRKRIKPNIGKMLRGLQQTYIENGVTTAQDGAANASNLSILKLADMTGQLKIDVVAYPLLSENGAALCAKNAAMMGKYKKHIRIGGYKMLLDGSPQGRSAWMSQPYLGGDPDYCGYPWLTDDEAFSYAKQAIDANMQLLAHCNGDAASEQFLNAYEKALAASDNPDKHALRPVMIHCQTVRNDQLDRMAKIAMIPSIFVGHVYFWGDVHLRNFGPERGHHISPVRDALDRSLVVNFHQDTPVTKPNMLHSVWCAVNRISREGRVIGEDQKISVYDALKAVTIHAAYQYGEEQLKGSIRSGKYADLVILDQCPMDTDPMKIRDIRVLETIRRGKTIYTCA